MLRDGSGSGTGLVGVPLTYDGQVVGLLGLVAPDADGVTNERLHQLSRLAALASAAAASAGRRSQGATSGAVLKARTG
jgi:GAF domain-containing protein